MDPSLMLFGAAYHWSEPGTADKVAEYSNFNPGLGLKLDFLADGVKANIAGGAYRNSINEISHFFGPGMEIGDKYGFQVSMMYIDGYNNSLPPVLPVVGAFVRYKRVSLHSIYVGAGIGFYVEIKL